MNVFCLFSMHEVNLSNLIILLSGLMKLIPLLRAKSAHRVTLLMKGCCEKALHGTIYNNTCDQHNNSFFVTHSLTRGNLHI